MIFDTIRVIEDNLSLPECLTRVLFSSSKLTNLFIEEVGFYLYPSAAIIAKRNSCDSIARKHLMLRLMNFSINAYFC